MKCLNPIMTKTGLFRCGKCLACNATKVDEKLKRMNAETKASTSTLFVTLTYDEEHAPNYGIEKTDLQNFIKEVKKKHNIKYTGIGEYGGRNKRPHYHIIIWFKDEIKTPHNELEPLWKQGITCIRNVKENECNYIAKFHANKIVNESIYHIKNTNFYYKKEDNKINDNYKAKNFKNEVKCNPCFIIQSNGIGVNILQSSELQTNIKRDKFTLKNNQKRETQIPRYIIEKLTPYEQGQQLLNRLKQQQNETQNPSTKQAYINASAQYPEMGENRMKYYNQQKAIEWEKKYQDNVIKKKLHQGL